MTIWPNDLNTGWWSFSLPGFRDHPHDPATYSLFDYEDLPPIEPPKDAKFTWLWSEPRHEQWSLAANGYADGSRADISRLPELVDQAQVALPPDFVEFMQVVALHERLRSCTACFLQLNEFIVRVTKPVEGVLLNFLSDQQYCIQWYLYASRSGDHCITVSSEIYGLQFETGVRPKDEVDLTKVEMWMCAPNFTEFIYRFWLENEIWFRVIENGEPPSPIQKDYLDYYSRLKSH